GLRKRWEDELDASIEAEYRRRRTEALALLHWWLRDVWLVTARSQSLVASAATDRGGDFLTSPGLVTSTQKITGRLKEAQAMENLNVIDETQQILHTNAQEALALEVSFLKLKL